MIVTTEAVLRELDVSKLDRVVTMLLGMLVVVMLVSVLIVTMLSVELAGATMLDDV